MKILRITRTTLTAALAPLALAGAILAPGGAAMADSQPAQAHARAATDVLGGPSRGFDVYNTSKFTLDLAQVVAGNSTLQGQPPVGSELPPGGHHHFEIDYAADLNGNVVKAVYLIRGRDSYIEAHMGINLLGGSGTFCQTGTLAQQPGCSPAPNYDPPLGTDAPWTPGNTITFSR